VKTRISFIHNSDRCWGLGCRHGILFFGKSQPQAVRFRLMQAVPHIIRQRMIPGFSLDEIDVKELIGRYMYVTVEDRDLGDGTVARVLRPGEVMKWIETDSLR